MKNVKKKNLDNQVEKLIELPNSLEAEQSILGGLMLDNEQWDYISEKISENDFFSLSHQLIFREMKYLLNKGYPIDLITLSESLEQKGKLEYIGRFAYLAELSKNVPSTANITTYADIVRERSMVRKIIKIANKIIQAGYDPRGKTSQELLNLAESKILSISEQNFQKNSGPKNIEELLDITLANIEKLFNTPYKGITGINTGYQDLNNKTSGLQPSDLIIIAARPSMGKTTFAMNICENIAMTYKKPVLIFSLEMSGEQIMMRMLSSLSRVNQEKLRTGQLNDEDWARISSTINILLKKKNMYIDDSSTLTPSEMRSRSRKIYRENNGLSLIMVDYLQLIKVPSLIGNRTLEIAEISRMLKSLAKELKIPIIALSQLNRSLEQRRDKRPINSDLRESGSLEQDADLIMFIYRDELYHEHTDLKGIAEIIIGKQRNGPIGTIKLTFNGHWSRFDNYSESKYSDE
ncbi:replicative DNA helicase [Buchnera aphidicola str. Bp (Baizongia pistaciae)]|uniref:Replicative DNA helicase DnaB n=1 Tax=Buchnera aphidicola subsp. Baizongia pistaciae (strain Bp) TaxID=224915 RepID=DNAB_BUCBP|nr:RecName: Full=Replicative DNA helicase [Buchnera aphidicola str. Bp (Baizongia pistaciae)]AAO27194.1 replicative DNA helicase [Buchnera aphidicola str. Bp (Baizongia pistaciae)]